MSYEPRITDVGADEEPRQRQPWLLPVLVGVGGFALGLLVATTISSAGPSEPSATLPPVGSTESTDDGPGTTAAPGSTATASNSSTTSTTPVELTIEERVPGFEGTLYFVNSVSSSTLNYEIAIWSSEAAAPSESGLPAGVLALDSSGTRLAVLSGSSLDREFNGGVIRIFWNLDKSRPPLWAATALSVPA